MFGYSGQMREITDQKNSKYEHFSRSYEGNGAFQTFPIFCTKFLIVLEYSQKNTCVEVSFLLSKYYKAYNVIKKDSNTGVSL